MEVVPISARVPTVDYRRVFKAVKENTSSSFSGLHYGHYKALFTHNGLDAVEASWLNAPFHLGFSSRRSQRGLDIMLEKRREYETPRSYGRSCCSRRTTTRTLRCSRVRSWLRPSGG